tara:strand:- start:517 stop:756 length:240 start_codon:yes stop_codon:yes gene_type:complete
MIKLKDLYPKQASFIGIEEPVKEEKLNERTDSRAKRDLMRALKNSKVSHAYSYDNDQIAMEMTNDETYIIGNIRRYEDD